MKTSTIATSSKFSIPSLTRHIAKFTAIILGTTFSTVNAQDPHPGEALFKTKCTMCHGQAGEGIAVFPPLAGSEWVNGPAENLVRIQLRGLMGPINVKGKAYNAMMPANAVMSDQDIADVLTYVRSNMGNKAPAVTADLVKEIRAKEAGNTAPLTVADLIDPAAAKPAPEAKDDTKDKAKALEEKKAKEKKIAKRKAKAAEKAAAEAKEKAEAKPAPEPVKPMPEENSAPEAKPAAPEAPATDTAEGGHPGQALFQTKCVMCHGDTGEGMANTFPPLAGSEWVNGPAENLIKIQLHGLTGPIEVKGQLYNSVMPPNALMTDQEIADVLTYVRSSMGNSASAITADMVKPFRGPDNATPLTAKDLIDPTLRKDSITEDTELAGFKPAESNGGSSIIMLTLGIIGACTVPAAAGLLKN